MKNTCNLKIYKKSLKILYLIWMFSKLVGNVTFISLSLLNSFDKLSQVFIMSSIKFQTGLNNLKSHMSHDISIDKNALNFLDSLCNNVHEELVAKCNIEYQKEIKKSHDAQLTDMHVQHAVKGLLKKKLQEYALSEGTDAVNKFSDGSLKFSPKKNKKTIAVSDDKSHVFNSRKCKHVFNEGIKKLMEAMGYYSSSYKGNAVEMVDRILMLVLCKLCCKAINHAMSQHSQVVSALDMQKAVYEMLHASLLKSALAEGCKAVMMHSFSSIQILPPPHKRQPSETVKKRKPANSFQFQKKPPQKKRAKTTISNKHVDSPPKPDFSQAICSQLQEMTETGTISKKATLFVNQCLLEVCNKLAKTAIERLRHSFGMKLLPQHIKLAMEKEFQTDVRELAMMHSDREITYYTTGLSPMHDILEEQNNPISTAETKDMNQQHKQTIEMYQNDNLNFYSQGDNLLSHKEDNSDSFSDDDDSFNSCCGDNNYVKFNNDNNKLDTLVHFTNGQVLKFHDKDNILTRTVSNCEFSTRR